MREWIPTKSSAKGRLVIAALEIFGARPADEVTVGELAAAASVTTGALYHHFGSKAGLRDVVREDVERRVLDRLDAAAAVARTSGADAPPVLVALTTTLDFAASGGFLRLLDQPPADDVIAAKVGELVAPAPPLVGVLLTAAWREALTAIAHGATPEAARDALIGLARLR